VESLAYVPAVHPVVFVFVSLLLLSVINNAGGSLVVYGLHRPCHDLGTDAI
jgi:hypothetical protein